jgi:hypothetical protein
MAVVLKIGPGELLLSVSLVIVFEIFGGSQSLLHELNVDLSVSLSERSKPGMDPFENSSGNDDRRTPATFHIFIGFFSEI